ncbi:tubulin polyglutamylase complex subunit 2-like [Onthophagus taurus]|uniref:tubulin polyglutamylase complex subunit 2-like n=1 Tax=Onthophagus taurus TaxID=166361 RepID=UPI0039BDDDA0
MNFIIETITPDFFYYNLLLGLPKILDNHKHSGIKKKHLVRFEPATVEEIAIWESTNQLILPLDLKNFYLSSNGFLYQWICSYGHQKLLVMGKITIYPLHKLNELKNFQLWINPEIEITDNTHELRLGMTSKVFEMCNVEDDYKICLVYVYPEASPSIWLFSKSNQFFYLAKNFTEYFRMCIVHLGIPHWQLAYTTIGLPEWVKILMRLLCPAVLQSGKQKGKVELIATERITRSTTKYINAPTNVLDLTVFNGSYHPKRRVNEKINDSVEVLVLKSPARQKLKSRFSKAHKQKNKTKKF